MEEQERKKHWEDIYHTKSLNEVSWYQPIPQTSLELIAACQLPKDAKIIDVGGGDGFLVDHLLDNGYLDLTVLDISKAAIDRAKQRLGDRADQVQWIVADASSFTPDQSYDLWHDRAAFHFLTQKNDIDHYLKSLSKGLSSGAYLILGTFSENGPKKCSGIEIKQYSALSMQELLKDQFEVIKTMNVDHPTPFDTVQNFTFGSFKKL
ncbi:class I SAM-dependent methyltransferase [Reichenbachiella ulvae]|uniref:Class I SAM-dependent methyltransferase n=1 Tax=Reichenbachiella ulvae TaxID=2980104 RepID=A0ABT3CV16_9BACT|nr:class I SAM-dependent methyltransferase [Reichenbachiella ulvae]MCV9387546.1 class I SAM-dependent methyltransferase [Reichenbachiella ulvae]